MHVIGTEYALILTAPKKIVSLPAQKQGGDTKNNNINSARYILVQCFLHIKHTIFFV